MADSEDWRRQRAIKLGLEPYSDFNQRPSSSSNGHLIPPLTSLPPASREGGAIDDSVVAMRSPPPDRTGVHIEKTREPSARPTTQAYLDPSARQGKVTDARVKPQSATVNMPGKEPRAERDLSVYVAGATFIAVAAGGAWFALQQVQPPPTLRPLIRVVQAEPAVALAAMPPFPVSKPHTQSELQTGAAVTCDKPAIVAELQAIASNQLKRSSPRAGPDSLITVAGISSARSKIAAAGGGLMICTAALNLRLASGKTATFDVDYTFQTVGGSRPRVEPLGFKYLIESITAGALVDPPDAASTLATLPPTATAKKRDRATALPSRIVVVAKPTFVSTRFLADTTSPGSGLQGARGLSLTTSEPVSRLGVVNVPRGCEQPETLSVSITCKNASLLALNAEIAAALAALDRPGNERILARIKKRADLRFDHCQSVSCVGNASRIWLRDLARLTQNQNGTMTAERQDQPR